MLRNLPIPAGEVFIGNRHQKCEKGRLSARDESKRVAQTNTVKIFRTFGKNSDLIFHSFRVIRLIRFFKFSFPPLILLVLGSACSTIQSHDNQFNSVFSQYERGNVEAAAAETETRSFQKKLKSNDRLLWAMEAGKLHHAAGDFHQSNRYFEEAEAIIQDFEDRAIVSLRAGAARAGAFLTNPAAIAYRGSSSDKILINTYKALNYLALGDLEGARVETRRAYERQQEAIEKNRKAIEEARSEGEAFRSAMNDPALEKAAPVDPAVAQAYADFANPFTTLLSGIIALADRDPARAEVDFRLLTSLPIPNEFVEEEAERIRIHLSGQNSAAIDRPRVFVIFENGLGPNREEMRVDLLLPDIGYTGFAFPQLEFQPTNVSSLQISTTDSTIASEQIASIDQIVATEFQTRIPAMVFETIASVVTKE